MPRFLGVVDMNTKYKVIKADRWDQSNGINNGDTMILINDDGLSCQLYKHENTGFEAYMYRSQFVLIGDLPNRQYLQEFLKINNIKKTLVSKVLGKSENWLTQMANDTRRDMTEETLQRILKMLHIDWSSDKTLHVKTKGYVPYTTKPCTYHTDMHKERLQKAFWNGEVVLP